MGTISKFEKAKKNKIKQQYKKALSLEIAKEVGLIGNFADRMLDERIEENPAGVAFYEFEIMNSLENLVDVNYIESEVLESIKERRSKFEVDNIEQRNAFYLFIHDLNKKLMAGIIK